MTGEPILVPDGYRVDRWRVRELIGSGAWGSVYAADEVADDDEGGHTVATGGAALKFLPTTSLTPGQRALLVEVVERESRFSLRADHPHLIRTLAVHTLREPDHPDLDGAVVLVMERAAANLRDLLAAAGVPDPARLLEQVCDALAHMHAEGWVHGDLKPGNVLIMSDGSARIADFGVTAQIEGTHAYAPRIGSSDYLPPEWWTERVGEKGIPLRPTADIWAFGVLAHQALTGGMHPFPGAAQQSRAMAAQSYANGTAQLRLDAGIAPAWRQIIADCLAPDHESRAAHDAAGILARNRANGGDVAY
jgi:serine/threonine protein kinase